VEAYVHSWAFAGPYMHVADQVGCGEAASDGSRVAVPSFPGHTDAHATSADISVAFGQEEVEVVA
jgi:hypothetical protein